MRIVLVTPYLAAARNGNAHTAVRWLRFLRRAGHGVDELPEDYRAKTQVIRQSAPTLQPAPRPTRTFDVCVVAHLREEKDPFRAAYAARLLPAATPVCGARPAVHAGTRGCGGQGVA
ncbi:MAG: hypothetical protein Q8Q28_04960 [Pseudomonadota bacterium]|nr:hypothetical protein [Pseudomonadota bacterium]